MGGRLEHEIRRIPHVVACSIVDGEIVVLIAPDAYQPTLERSVRKVVAASGRTAEVRVIGGIEPIPAVLDPIVSRRRAVLVGSAAGFAALAATSLFAGLSVQLPGAEQALQPGPAVERPDRPATGGGTQVPFVPRGAAPQRPVFGTTPSLIDVFSPILAGSSASRSAGGGIVAAVAGAGSAAPTTTTRPAVASVGADDDERRIRTKRAKAGKATTARRLSAQSHDSCASFAEARARSRGKAPRARTMQGNHGGRAWTCWFAAHWRSR